ncbi:unnamed protein product [Trichobilharzia szidati]|nr:unnamed protein product [Trichobilharzia szidati]
MKTRGSQYNSDLKNTNTSKKSLNAKNARSHRENTRKRSKTKRISRTKRRRTSEVYKSSHLVGRRKASNFVTYTQNGRLFYDIYVRESPYNSSKVISTNQSENIIADARLPNGTKRRKKSVGVGGLEDGKDLTSKALVRTKSTVLKRTVQSTSTNVQPAKLLKKPRGRRKKNPDIDRTLTRELGPNYASPDQDHGKRLASLNATAIMGAFNSKSSRKKCRKSNGETNFHSQPDSSVSCLHADEVDDATTEPMCSADDDYDLAHCLETPSSVSIEPNNVIPAQNPILNKETAPSSFKSICQMNPAIESFHSQRIIPLGHDTYGVQQITHQVVVVPPTNEVSQTVCQPKVQDFNTPIARVPAGSVVSFPTLPYSKPNDCSFNETVLHQRTGQVLYSPMCPSLLQQNVNSWGSALPCITTPNMTPSFFACSPPNILLPHITSSFVVSNPSVTPQIAYPLILQPVPSMPTSYMSSGFPYGFVSPVFLPTSWTQPGMLPCQPPSTPVNNNSDASYPMMIAPAQMIPINQTQNFQVSLNPCTNWISNGGFDVALNRPMVVQNACRGSEQAASEHDGKSFTDDPSVCNSSFHVVNNCPVVSCEAPVINRQEEDITLVPASNPSILPIRVENVPLDEVSSAETRDLNICCTKEPDQSTVCLDNQKDAWIWEGEPFVKPVFHQSDSPPIPRECYPAIRHRRDGMVIRVKDNVLLCSGPSRSHPPHVAKIVALYYDKNTDTKMMSLLWYYRPEHINGAAQNFVKNELYASRHRDTNPLDCIEDKAFVLSVNAYSRYMAKVKRQQTGYRKMPLSSIVPQPVNCSLHTTSDSVNVDNLYMDKYPLAECDECFNTTSSQSVFFCRGVYDYKLKRITRYPIFSSQCLLSSHLNNRLKCNEQFPPTTPQKDSTEQNNQIVSNGDHCSEINTPEKMTTSSRIDNSVEPVTPVRENVPFSAFSTPAPSAAENANNFTISQSEFAELNCQAMNNSHIGEQCQDISYDNGKGRTSTPVKETNNYCQSSITRNMEPVKELPQTLVTKVNSNESVEKPLVINILDTIPERNSSTPAICVTSSSSVQPVLTSHPSVYNKPFEVRKDSNVPLQSGTVPYGNKPANQLVCQPNPSSIQPIWPTIVTTNPLINYDRSVLETSADLSVNWAEHGEQIALSLDCRVKETNINITPATIHNNGNCNGQTASHTVIHPEMLTSTQSFVDMTKLPVHANSSVHYSTLNSKCLDQDQPRLVIL